MVYNSKLASAMAPPRRASRQYSGGMSPAREARRGLRAPAALAALAALALAVSQFLEYRSVAVGTADYDADPSARAVAPAPPVESENTGSAHAWLLLPAAVVALGALGVALRRRLAAAALLAAAIGLAGVAVALVVDLPAAMDEGAAAVAYEGVRASVEYGLWVELAAAGTLALAAAALGLRIREDG